MEGTEVYFAGPIVSDFPGAHQGKTAPWRISEPTARRLAVVARQPTDKETKRMSMTRL